jgi:hypothetical protein
MKWQAQRLFILIALQCAAGAFGQAVNPALLDRPWPAWWIAHPTASPTDPGVFHFRKAFALATKPDHFVVHVSADNRYRLFVNGRSVSTGPAQSDLLNWRFETLDLAPYLAAGNNLLAAVVWNGGIARPMAQISHRTGFLLQADDPANSVVNTGSNWKVIEDSAYSQIVYKDNDPHFRHQYYVAGPGEQVDAAKYPWGWEQPAFDDSAWPAAAQIDHGAPWGVESHQRWQLKPRSVPFLTEDPQRFQRVARTEGAEVAPGFVAGSAPIRIPANSKATILLDQGTLTVGYPVMRVSGGTGAQVRLTYSEALYDSAGQKGNRNEIEGKQVMGPEDVFRPDGAAREYQPLWTRNWRWVQLDIETQAEPLAIEDISSLLCVYPASRVAVFESDSKDLQAIWDAAWRTLQLNAQETFINDIAWERMQYVADTKEQALTWLNLTGDDRLVRLAIEDFDNSRVPFGLTQARYPANLEQFTASYSLYWASMVHDYWVYRGDDEFTRRFLPGISGVLGWWEQQLKAHGDLPVTYSRSPCPITDRFVFALTLKESAEVFEHFGQNDQAAHYRELAAEINRETYASHFDPQSGFLRDTPKLGTTQEVNALAVLADAVPPDAQRGLMERMLADPNVKPGPARFMFFRFELGRALRKTGLGDRFVETLGPWEDMIRDGMTTLAEFPQHTRSDCHPWAASPAYEFLSTIAGIEPASPGFKTVRIEPSLGTLQHVHAVMPHPLGPIEVWLDRTGDGLHARVYLPQGLTGVFVWNGQEKPISGTVDLKFPTQPISSPKS